MTINGKLPDRVAAELRYHAIIRDQRLRMYDFDGAIEAMRLYNLVYNRWYDDNRKSKNPRKG